MLIIVEARSELRNMELLVQTLLQTRMAEYKFFSDILYILLNNWQDKSRCFYVNN